MVPSGRELLPSPPQAVPAVTYKEMVAGTRQRMGGGRKQKRKSGGARRSCEAGASWIDSASGSPPQAERSSAPVQEARSIRVSMASCRATAMPQKAMYFHG